MLNVVVTLYQRCGNVLTTSESNLVATSETDVGTALIFDSATTLWHRQQRRCNNVVITSLCQLGKSCPKYYDRNIAFHKSLENRCRSRCSSSQYSRKGLEGKLQTESSWLRINKVFFSDTLKRKKLQSMGDNSKKVSLTASQVKLIQY